ncbi:DUF19 domain-containing protein [Balamuthia mandrillaris]
MTGVWVQRAGQLEERQRRILRLLQDLEKRVCRKEEEMVGLRHGGLLTVRAESGDWEESCQAFGTEVARVRDGCLSLGLRHVFFRFVPEECPYYEHWDYRQRIRALGGYSIHQLCKTILLENTRCTRQDCKQPHNSRYYAVVVQYTTKLQSQKLIKFLRSLPQNKHISKKSWNFCLADEEATYHLTRFSKNALSPIAAEFAEDIPIVLSDSIARLDPPFIWLGGGQVNVKLGVDVREFIQKTHCFVADVCVDAS